MYVELGARPGRRASRTRNFRNPQLSASAANRDGARILEFDGGVEPPLARYASGRHRVRWLGTGKGEESTPARTNGPGLDGSRFSGRCGAPCRNADQPLGLRVASLTDGAGDPAPSAVPPTRRNPLGDWRSSVWGDSTTRIYPEMGADRPALAPEPFAEAAAYRCVTQSPHAWRTSLRRASRSGR